MQFLPKLLNTRDLAYWLGGKSIELAESSLALGGFARSSKDDPMKCNQRLVVSFAPGQFLGN